MERSNTNMCRQSKSNARNDQKMLHSIRYQTAKNTLCNICTPLEFAVPVWSPYQKSDIDLLVGVQHRATRLIPSLKKKNLRKPFKDSRFNNTNRKKTKRRYDSTFQNLQQYRQTGNQR